MADEDDKGSSAKKPAVSFETEGEFHAAVERKTKKAVASAIAEARKSILADLGVEDGEDVSALKEKLASSQKGLSELEQAKKELAKTTSTLRSLEKQAAELGAFKATHLKRTALAPFAGRTADKTGETLVDLLGPKLVIGDDGAVTGPDGVPVEKLVEDLISSRPFLKAPDYKPGGGTSAKGAPAPAPAGQGGQANQNGANVDPVKAFSLAMQAEHARASGGGGGP